MRRATHCLLAATLALLSWSCAKAEHEPFGKSRVLMLKTEERTDTSAPPAPLPLATAEPQLTSSE